MRYLFTILAIIFVTPRIWSQPMPIYHDIESELYNWELDEAHKFLEKQNGDKIIWESISGNVNHADIIPDLQAGGYVLLNENMQANSIYEIIPLLRLRMHISAKLGDQKKFYDDYTLLNTVIEFIDPDLRHWAND